MYLSRCGGMADATDSKSVEGNFMWVRLPPSAPRLMRKFQDFLFCLFGSRTLGFWVP